VAGKRPLDAEQIRRDASLVSGTQWFQMGRRSPFHMEAPDWVRSGKGLCGADISKPGMTVVSPMPGQTKLCEKCLAILRKGRDSGAREVVREKSHANRTVHAPQRMDSFTRAYFEAALWASTDESNDQGGEPLDKNYGINDFAPDTRAKMIDDCVDFQQRYRAMLDNAYGESGINSEKAGHNFWLSRNGHGAGFFDDNLDNLQEAAESYGEFNLYVGDDGEIHGS
jgi:hypothetical protein